MEERYGGSVSDMARRVEGSLAAPLERVIVNFTIKFAVYNGLAYGEFACDFVVTLPNGVALCM